MTVVFFWQDDVHEFWGLGCSSDEFVSTKLDQKYVDPTYGAAEFAPVAGNIFVELYPLTW